MQVAGSCSLCFCCSINLRSVNHVCRNKRLLELGLDAAQALLGFHAVAVIAGTQTKVRLRIGKINGNIGKVLFKLLLDFLSVLQGLVANFHEHMDAIAAE